MSLVYFIESPAAKAIKIGITTNLPQRIAALQSASGVALVVLATVPGARTDEARLHRRFSAQRMSGEWFTNDGDLRAFVDRIAPLTAEQATAAINEDFAIMTDDDLEWANEINEIIMDACHAVIRDMGVVRCAEELTKRWGPKGRRVRSSFLINILEGRNHMRAEWLHWFQYKSGAVRDAVDLMIGVARAGKDQHQRDCARRVWEIRSRLRAAIGDEKTEELILEVDAA